ncbi:MAG: YihA family ribosome biogenesis GTP-binding protein [Flavobacteriales bacterium]|nr:YihA family ribosome biogenesis GTP-binding protein [Flavobacteriales bacterium]
MKIHSAEFLISNTDYRKCPKAEFPEYAFIGRSNVGKSSLINMLCERKKLAKTSSTPGKTQLINHFLINENIYLVDLPGYGFAKASKKEREKWEKMIQGYLNQRPNLLYTFVLIDSRIPPQKIDLEFMAHLGKKQIPFVMLFTKIDKLSSSALNKNLTAYKKAMLKEWEEMPPVITTSSESKFGKEDVWNLIEQTNRDFSISLH